MDPLTILGVVLRLSAILGRNWLEGGHLESLANGPALVIVLGGTIGAILGLGAAYTGYCGRPIGRPAFWLLNVLSISLIFANPWVTAVAAPLVLLVLVWHARKGADTPSATTA